MGVAYIKYQITAEHTCQVETLQLIFVEEKGTLAPKFVSPMPLKEDKPHCLSMGGFSGQLNIRE